MMRAAACLPMACLALASAAPAAVLEVRPDGSGDFLSLQAAADAAAAGDTIVVGGGRYEDWSYELSSFGLLPSHMLLRQPGITVLAAQGEDVRIGPASWTWEEHANHPIGILAPPEAAGVRVVGITVENLPQGLSSYAGFAVEDSRFVGNGRAIIAEGPGPASMLRTVVEDTRSQGVTLGYFTGAVRIRDCVFRGEEAGLRVRRCPTAELHAPRFQDRAGLVVEDGSYVLVQGGSWEGRGIGVRRATLEIHDSRIGVGHHSGIGVDGGHLAGSGNVVLGGYGFDDVVLYLSDGASADFRGNHILRRYGRLVEVQGYRGRGASIDLRENYWGDDRAIQIEWLIEDGHDEGNEDEPVVDWQPFSATPVATGRSSFGGLKGRH